MAEPTKPIADYGGARGSNAGDQFHELWALQRALSLLDVSVGLKALTVEGISSEVDAANSNANAWEGVDCGLYYGGTSNQTADRIELVQLKYSSADPDKNWTIARLSSSSAKKTNNSVFRRLAYAFVAARKEMKAGATLVVRLVSNQPVADEVLTLIRIGSDPANSATSTDADFQKHLTVAKTATGLTDGDLSALLHAFDVSECGSDSRFALRDSVLAVVAKSIGEDANPQVRELQTRIRELMLPERVRELITSEVVLGWFGIANSAGLFPAPSDFKVVKDAILREPAKKLLNAVSDGPTIVCLVGPAGCGKTTTLLHLGKLLTPASVFVTFDCYGAGRYIHSNDRRHLPENAFTQIANELNLAIGAPFILPRGSRNPVDIKRFLEQLTSLSAVLERTHKDALLVIGIDAADNAVTAASRPSIPEKCFVHELTQADPAAFPKNVRLVFSTRPGRKGSLQLPTDTKEIVCPAFDPAETAQFVQRTFPAATPAWIDQFHALSHGIPRVQDYAMQAGAGDAEKSLNALRPGGKDLNDVLRQFFKTASDKIGRNNLYETLTASLAALPAPIPSSLLAAVSGTSEADVLDFIADIRPSLRSDAEGISIADEDVEDFIQREGAPGLAAARIRACDEFSRAYLTNEYAAIHYADMLVETGRAADILAIIEADLTPAAISDPIIRREVQLRRLRFAMRACRQAGTLVDSSKVLLLAAEASKGEAALTEILENETDLSIRFARSSLMRLVLSDPDSASQQGDVLAHDAARAARAGDLIQAREQLHYHNVWLERLHNRPKDEKREWNVEDTQLTARIEAIALVGGARAAVNDLSRWTPQIVHLKIGIDLVHLLISRGNASLLEDVLREKLVPVHFEFVVLVPLLLSGASIDLKRLEASLAGIRGRLLPKWHNLGYAADDQNWRTKLLDLVVTGCEIAYANGLSSSAIKHALSSIADFEHPLTTNRSRLDATSLDILLRGWLIWRSLDGGKISVEEFSDYVSPKPPPPPPPSKKRGRKGKKSKTPPPREREDETRKYGRAVYSVYDSRRRILAHRAGGGSVLDEQLGWISSFSHAEYWFESDYSANSYRAAAAQSVLALMHLTLPPDGLMAKAAELVNTKWSDPFATRVKKLWSFGLLRASSHPFVLCEITKKWQLIKVERAPASDKVGALINLSRLALNFSEADAKALFEDAVAKAQEIDREAIDQIQFTSTLSRKCSSWPPSARKKDAALLFRFVTDVAIRLSDNDGFPWNDAIEALCRLSPSLALAAISRWSDEALRDLPPSLSSLVGELTKRGVMISEVGVALLVLLRRADAQLLDDILSTLSTGDKTRLTPVLDMLVVDCELNIPPGDFQEIARVILNHAQRFGLQNHAAVKRMEAAVAFLESNKPAPEPESDSYQAPEARAEKPLPDFTGLSFLTTIAVQEGIEAVRASGALFATGAALARMRAVTTNPNDYTSFLNAISYSDLGPYADPDRAEAIINTLNAWGYTPAIQEWRLNELPKVIVENFGGLTRWLKQGSSPLKPLLDTTTLPPKRIGEILIEGVQKAGLAMGSRSLFAVAEYLTDTLSATQAQELHHWYVRRLNERIPPDSLAIDVGDLPDSFDEATGRFFFALFSDIDTRIRWKAAHAVRRLARLGMTGALSATFANLNRTQDASFRDSTAPFYWMAAKLWSLVTISRISAERPDLVAPLLPVLLDTALDNTFPHFLMREHAKTAVLMLFSSGHATDAQRTAVANVNISPFSRIRERKNRPTHIAWEDSRKRGLHFGMDIMEEWYQPILRMFATLTKYKLLDAAHHWLVDQWKMTETTSHWDTEPRKGRLSDRQHALWSSSKGHLPAIERHALYLEWHGMFCVVGQLLSIYPLKSGDDYRSFEEWLQNKVIENPPLWGADKREAKPLWPSLWFKPQDQEKYWLSRAARDKFLSVLQPDGTGPDSFINVYGDWTSAFPTRETSIRITSALVPPTKAAALAAALLNYDNHWGFSFPHQGDDHEEKSGAYTLTGWVGDERGSERFDERDPLRNGVTRDTLTPASLLKTLKPDGPHRWMSRDGRTAARFVAWSDLPENVESQGYGERETKSYGYCLQVHSDVLSSLLSSRRSDLIVSINLIRRVENEYRNSYETDSKKRKSFNKILILRGDGKIEDFKGVVGTWRRANK